MRYIIAISMVAFLVAGCSMFSVKSEAKYHAINFAGTAIGYDFDDTDHELETTGEGNIFVVAGTIKRDFDKKRYDIRAEVELLTDIKKWRCNSMTLDGVLLYER